VQSKHPVRNSSSEAFSPQARTGLGGLTEARELESYLDSELNKPNTKNVFFDVTFSILELQLEQTM
jgi:hypothetical protein